MVAPIWEPVPPSEVSCLACHAEIRRLVAAHQGAVLVLPRTTYRTEYRGRQVRWPRCTRFVDLEILEDA